MHSQAAMIRPNPTSTLLRLTRPGSHTEVVYSAISVPRLKDLAIWRNNASSHCASYLLVRAMIY